MFLIHFHETLFQILALLHSMEETFDILKQKLPEEYSKVEKEVEELRAQIHDMIVEIEKTLVMSMTYFTAYLFKIQ